MTEVTGPLTEQPIPTWPCDVEALEPGLYRTPETKIGDIYAITQDGWYKNARQALLIRVDDGKELPAGMDAAFFRADGRRVIKAWALDDDSAELEPFRQ